jgi:hypothetical protein
MSLGVEGEEEVGVEASGYTKSLAEENVEVESAKEARSASVAELRDLLG